MAILTRIVIKLVCNATFQTCLGVEPACIAMQLICNVVGLNCNVSMLTCIGIELTCIAALLVCIGALSTCKISRRDDVFQYQDTAGIQTVPASGHCIFLVRPNCRPKIIVST